MTPLHASYPNLAPNDFTLRLDSGPLFHPKHAHLEGEDPISIAVFLDLNTHPPVATTFVDALRQVPNWLTAHDTLSVYALRCALIKALPPTPYTSDLLTSTLAESLSSPKLNAPYEPGAADPDQAACADGRLWDTMSSVVRQLSTQPGRRVLLAITSGMDEASLYTWKQLQLYAGHYNVTIIGLRTPIRMNWNDSPTLAYPALHIIEEDAFGMLCGQSGGTVLPVDTRTLGLQLQRAIALLRNRYILEFPRPVNGSSGLHDIEVRTKDRRAIVRPAGITFPIRDNKAAQDPTTVPSDNSHDPVVGDRKIITQPR